ncbi:MAG: tetratricopeptide repeat protein [Anaerolineae bacterium]|nr:tetratricopeptide repeat protein [Anaerolineae bacterium]
MKRQRLIYSVLILVILPVLTACGPGQPVAIPTVTPLQMVASASPAMPAETVSGGPPAAPTPSLLPATPAPTLTVTPIPTLALTATPAPPEPLLVAARHMRNANYRATAAIYQQILTQDNLRADAEFGLAEVALRMGGYEDAVARFAAFIDAHPDNARLAWAHFLRADAYYELGRLDPAIADYRRYLALRPGLIDSYVYARIAELQAALGRWDEALASYLAAIDAGREPEGLQALREEVAALDLARQDYAAAAAQYEAILAAARDRDYRAGVMYRLAEARLALDDQAAAYALLSRLVEEFAETPPAYQAMGALDNLGCPTHTYQRGLVSYFSADYQGALDAFSAYRATLPEGQGPALLLMYIGLAQKALGAPDAAGAAFQEVLDRYPHDALASQAMLMLGRLRFEAGEFAEAVELYIALAETYPASPEAPEAMWRAGYIYETVLGETERALATYDILGANYPGAAPAQDGLWRAVQLARAGGDNERAEHLLARLAESGAGEAPARGALWLGKLRAERGDLQGARAAWELGVQAAPDGYYGIRCADELAGRAVFQPPGAYRFAFDEARDIAEAEAWLVRTFGLAPPDGALWPLVPALEADPRLTRGTELWRLGWFDAARAEFSALRGAHGADPLAMYRLAIYFRSVGAYRFSVEAAAALIIMSGARTLEAPPFIARLRFPVYYDDLVLASADLYGVDPLFAFAMMRQESLFDGLATSHAAAYGLMQIIAATGQHIADQLNWADYSTEQLFYPHVSVTFGVFHLSDLLGLFDDDPYAALSAYNAGAGAASNWLDQSVGDDDLFMEVVDYRETRSYIKFITEYYAVYRELYGAKQPDSPGL